MSKRVQQMFTSLLMRTDLSSKTVKTQHKSFHCAKQIYRYHDARARWWWPPRPRIHERIRRTVSSPGNRTKPSLPGKPAYSASIHFGFDGRATAMHCPILSHEDIGALEMAEITGGATASNGFINRITLPIQILDCYLVVL